MRIVVFTSQLAGRTGGEINVRDWALGLKRRGHQVVVYAPVLGEMAHEIRQGVLAIVDDPSAITDTPDVAFGSGINEVAAIAARFPDVPVIQVSQQWNDWASFPSPLPQAVLHLAVDRLNAEILLNQFGVPRERVRIVHNAVDLSRLQPRAQSLPVKPQRALIFVKRDAKHADPVLEACAIRYIDAELVGSGAGAVIADPLSAMAACDLVVGSARIAIEAAAAGAAVLVADYRGLAGLLTTQNLEDFRANNFGQAILTKPLDRAAIGDEIDRYDAADAAAVSSIMQETASLDRQLERLEIIFSEAILLFRQTASNVDGHRKALASYLACHLPRHGEPSPRHALQMESLTERRPAEITRSPSFRDETAARKVEFMLRRIHQYGMNESAGELAAERRNLLENSEDFERYFRVGSIAAVELVKRIEPGRNEYLIAAIGSSSEHYVQHTIKGFGGALTCSLEAREAGDSKIRVQLLDGAKNGACLDFDFRDESFLLRRMARGSRVNGGFRSFGDGWYRLWVTAVLPGEEERLSFYIQLADRRGQFTFIPEGESILVRAIQLERGQLPSAYQAT